MLSLNQEKISIRRAPSQRNIRPARDLRLLIIRTGREVMQPIPGVFGSARGLIAVMMERESKLINPLGLGRGVSIFEARRGCKSDILDKP